MPKMPKVRPSTLRQGHGSGPSAKVPKMKTKEENGRIENTQRSIGYKAESEEQRAWSIGNRAKMEE